MGENIYLNIYSYYLPLSVVKLIRITLFFIINIIDSNGLILPYKFTFSIRFSSIIPSNKNELEPMQISIVQRDGKYAVLMRAWA